MLRRFNNLVIFPTHPFEADPVGGKYPLDTCLLYSIRRRNIILITARSLPLYPNGRLTKAGVTSHLMTYKEEHNEATLDLGNRPP